MVVENYSDSETNRERFPDGVSYSFIHLKINSFICRAMGLETTGRSWRAERKLGHQHANENLCLLLNRLEQIYFVFQ